MPLYKAKIKFLILIAVVFLLWYLGRFFPINTEAIENYLRRLPIFYSGIIFIILYCLVTFFIWLSKDLFRLIAALLFGAYYSTLLIWAAETINAFILFYLARFLGRAYVEDSLRVNKKYIDDRLAGVSFPWLFLFRAVPLIPFRFLDLGVGLTKVSFRRYIIAVILGSPLRIFWVQYVLCGVGKSVFSNPNALTEYLMQNKALFSFSLAYLVLVIVVAFKLKTQKSKRKT